MRRTFPERSPSSINSVAIARTLPNAGSPSNPQTSNNVGWVWAREGLRRYSAVSRMPHAQTRVQKVKAIRCSRTVPPVRCWRLSQARSSLIATTKVVTRDGSRKSCWRPDSPNEEHNCSQSHDGMQKRQENRDSARLCDSRSECGQGNKYYEHSKRKLRFVHCTRRANELLADKVSARGVNRGCLEIPGNP